MLRNAADDEFYSGDFHNAVIADIVCLRLQRIVIPLQKILCRGAAALMGLLLYLVPIIAATWPWLNPSSSRRCLSSSIMLMHLV